MKQIISFEKEIAFKTMIGEITSISLEHTLHFQNDSSVSGDLIISGTYKMTEASALEENFQYALPIDIMLTNELEEEDRLITIDNFTYAVMNEEILRVDVDILIQGLEKIEIEEEEEIERLEEEALLEQPKAVLNQEESEIDQKETESCRETITVEKPKEQEEDTKEKEKEEIFVRDEVKESLSTDEVTLSSASDLMDSKNKVDALSSDISMEPLPKQMSKMMTNQEGSHSDGAVMNSIFSAFANTDETYTTYSIYILREEDNLDEILNRYSITREDLGLYNNLDELKVGSKLIIPTCLKDE